MAINALRRKGSAASFSSKPSVAGLKKLRVVASPMVCRVEMRAFVSDMTLLGTTPPRKSGAEGDFCMAGEAEEAPPGDRTLLPGDP